MNIRTVPKNKPKWYQIRWKISNILVGIARKIYPENPEVKAFFMDIAMDAMIYGESFVRVKPQDIRND